MLTVHCRVADHFENTARILPGQNAVQPLETAADLCPVSINFFNEKFAVAVEFSIRFPRNHGTHDRYKAGRG